MLLAASCCSSRWPDRVRQRARDGAIGARRRKKLDEAPLGQEGGFELIMRDRYLLWIAVLTILLNVVNTTGGFLLNKFVETPRWPGSAIPTRMAESQRYRRVLRVVRRQREPPRTAAAALRHVARHAILGVRGALFILPVIALVNYSVIAVVPCWRSSASARSSRTARTTRFRTRSARRSTCRRHVRPSTRLRRPSIRSARGSATFFGGRRRRRLGAGARRGRVRLAERRPHRRVAGCGGSDRAGAPPEDA